jgi:hypothetical protein
VLRNTAGQHACSCLLHRAARELSPGPSFTALYRRLHAPVPPVLQDAVHKAYCLSNLVLRNRETPLQLLLEMRVGACRQGRGERHWGGGAGGWSQTRSGTEGGGGC